VFIKLKGSFMVKNPLKYIRDFKSTPENSGHFQPG